MADCFGHRVDVFNVRKDIGRGHDAGRAMLGSNTLGDLAVEERRGGRDPPLEGQEAGNTRLPGTPAQTQPSVDAIQEIAIQTSNYAAEYGQVGGGVFNVTMRSGTQRAGPGPLMLVAVP